MKLSIVIPSCNNAKWLGKCLDSITSQTYQDFEIIVVDDLSTDDSVEVAKNHLRKQDTLIINESKRLNGGTRNVGILKAKGDYILCIDCDDWLVDNKVLETIVNKLDVLGDIDILFTDYITHREDYDLMMHNRNNSIESALRNITCAIWTKIVKRELLQECLFPEGTLFEDRIQHYRLLLKAKSICNLDKPVIVWNRTNTNTISGNNTYLWNTYRFSYCGELYRLYNELEKGTFKDYIKEELEGYMKQIRQMVDDL